MLLDDVELNSFSDDSDVENHNNAAGTDEEDTDTAKVPTATAKSSETARQNRRPFAAISGSRCSCPQAPVWKSTVSDIPSLDFHAVPGPSRTVHRCNTALDFHVVFTTVLWNLLVFQTNLYYSQSVAVKPSLIEWVVTVDEMMAFIDIVIAMGVVRLSEIDDYWATDPILQHPWFASVM